MTTPITIAKPMPDEVAIGEHLAVEQGHRRGEQVDEHPQTNGKTPSSIRSALSSSLAAHRGRASAAGAARPSTRASEAEQVELALAGVRPRQQRPHQHQRDQSDGQVDVEHPAPIRRFGEPAAQDGLEIRPIMIPIPQIDIARACRSGRLMSSITDCDSGLMKAAAITTGSGTRPSPPVLRGAARHRDQDEADDRRKEQLPPLIRSASQPSIGIATAGR